MKTTSITKAPVGSVKAIIEPGTEGYQEIMDLKVRWQGEEKTLGQLIADVLEARKAIEAVANQTHAFKSGLQAWLEKNGYQVTGETLESLVNDVKALQVLNPKHRHSVAIMRNGYINEVIDISMEQILRNQVAPEDVNKGYYRVENGQIVLDARRREEMTSMD